MKIASSILSFFLSIRLTVVCLLLLSVLIVAGTLYQVEYGLFLAQKRFFDSWLILFWGFIPFPGTQTVLSLLFVNLFCNMILRFSYGWRQMGLVMIHMGLMLLLAGGWVTRQFGQESFLSLVEGEGSNVASDYREWEVAVWKEERETVRNVTAYDMKNIPDGIALPLDAWGFDLRVDIYHDHARAFRSTNPDHEPRVTNASGITMLEESSGGYDPQEYTPGGVFTLRGLSNSEEKRLLLFGGDLEPTRITDDTGTYAFSLRRKRHELPIFVQLLNFEREFHPNSDIPKSFSSLIEVDVQGVARQVTVEMNKPFRYQGYTFYQASYADLEQGTQLSTFAIALNYGRIIPYVATAMTFLGLAVHFLIQLYVRKGSRDRS